MSTLLLMGFGPFGDVLDNPAARLVRAVDGARVPAGLVRGVVMDVSYARCVAQTEAALAQWQPTLLLGVGVAVGRVEPQLESVAYNDVTKGIFDVDGASPDTLEPEGPALRRSTWFAGNAASHGIGRSDDAGRYVCNAWLYRCLGLTAGRIPTAFLHLPAEGLAPARLLDLLSDELPRTRV